MATGPDTDTQFPAGPGSRKAPGLAATVALYTVARLGLVTVIAALLSLAGVPLLLAILLALVVALPLSLVVFRGLRARLDLALAESGRRRGAQRDALRARLRGDEPTPEGSDGPDAPATRADADEPGGKPSDQQAEGETDPGPR
ncbi:DUF4229 domain-containing protein [Pseudonocardia halophobica]|uniref:DUF4229 domain-containing protein n=1 Tax=Pseudonocardia halophobica TaxID=29401 RepID=UPI003D89EE3F